MLAYARALAVGTAMLLVPAVASATCPSSETIISDLTCSSTITGSMDGSGSSDLEDYLCGTPYAGLAQAGVEDVYSFECQVTGIVTLEISGLSCDFDIYILDDSCDPLTGCSAGSTEAGTKDDTITFSCTAGTTYYVVIEGYGYSITTGPGQCSGTESYTLGFDLSLSTGCNEDCDDGSDNDLDGDTDCDDSDCTADPACTSCDVDGDGYLATASACGGTDCDDSDASVNPGASETCNSVDDDCDGTVDDGVTTTYYRDFDGDGYGDSSKTTSACSAPSGYVTDSTDCDDARIGVNPGATEVCDGLDNDCDGSVDEGVGSTWYADDDGDGYGDSSSSTTSCSAPTGYVANRTDCDDTSSSVNPGATEVCNSVDDDCDGTVDDGVKSTFYRDFDSDGYGDSATSTTACSAPSGYVVNKSDCDDKDDTTYPGATELCDGIDNDCDGTIDDGATGTGTWYADADSDGFGDASISTSSCSRPTGYVNNKTDCDDTDGSVYPGAAEVAYDGVDQDCDGADLTDVDEDGHDWDGVSGGTDCNDNDATVYPGASENADGADGDCDGTVDEETDWYDDDGDGYTEEGGDCDDADDTVHPAATEACDGVDEDCDGTVDDGTSCYDDDGDGYTEDDGDCSDGDPAANPGEVEILANGVDDDCDGVIDDGTYDADGDGYTEAGGDCVNTDGTVYPGAPEICDGLDNDCDKLVDEGTDCADDDGDGFSEDEGDCHDADADVHEGADEIPDNGIDDDCDDAVDEDGPRSDDDGDGYTEEGGDCDDADETVNPAENETENGVDDDCDDAIDENVTDVDGDGVTVADGDCDDYDGWIRPGLEEICDDAVDNNCNGTVDEACESSEFVDRRGGGCGCATGPAGLAGLTPLLLLFGFVRRRRL